MDNTRLLGLGLACGLLACASTSSGPSEQRYTVVKPSEQAVQTGGIPPDKEAEIQMVLKQRETSTRKCYQDVMNEKNDRKFFGSVKTLISLGTTGHATAVKIVGGTLGNKEVEDCLIATLKDFEYPQLTQAGDAQYEFVFRPAY